MHLPTYDWNSAEYESSGNALEASQHNLLSHWQDYLDRSMAFQRQCLQHCQGGSLAVLGAGRLLDLDLAACLDYCSEITFYDADPGVWPAWRAAQEQYGSERIKGQVIDLTGTVGAWNQALYSFLCSSEPDIELLSKFFIELEPMPAPVIRADTVLSLNMFGQLGAYWNNQTSRAISEHWQVQRDFQSGLFSVYPPPLEEARAQSTRKLEEQHLRLLTAAAARQVILISDVANTCYRNGQCYWQHPVLEVDCEKILLPGFNQESCADWQWDRIPQGVVWPELSRLTDVRAWHFRRHFSSAG